MRPDLAAEFASNGTTPPGFTDHTFATHFGVSLGARVWAAPSSFPGSRPFVTWTHGGAFVGGSHFPCRPWLVPAFHALGYHVIGNAYRLCPQVSLETSVSDCVNFVHWCRAELPGILGKDKVDIDRYAIAGESAGGFMVMAMALRLTSPTPPPRAVIDIYGLIDLFDARSALFTPVPADQVREPWTGEFSEEEVMAAVHDHDPARALADAPFHEGQLDMSDTELGASWATTFEVTKRVRLQCAIHTWVSRHGARGRAMYTALFHPERFAGEEEVKEYARTLSPYQVLETEAYTSGRKNFPPTAFMHGDMDEAVPVSQSVKMKERLRGLGVDTVMCVEPGAPHVYDQVYSHPGVPGWKEYIQPVVDFVQKHVEA